MSEFKVVLTKQFDASDGQLLPGEAQDMIAVMYQALTCIYHESTDLSSVNRARIAIKKSLHIAWMDTNSL